MVSTYSLAQDTVPLSKQPPHNECDATYFNTLPGCGLNPVLSRDTVPLSIQCIPRVAARGLLYRRMPL